jgi:hypothetical protein
MPQNYDIDLSVQSATEHHGDHPAMNDPRLELVLRRIDEANAADPNREQWQGQSHPKELLYGWRMSEWLERLCPEASAILRIAARGQHLRRWEVPRDSYPATREGYLRWRGYLYGFHGERVGELMAEAGYEPEAVARAKAILSKRGIKTDPEAQLIEDAACLVFLEHYFAGFAEGQDADKLVAIVRKTWNKMSDSARSRALALEFPDSVKPLLARALESA